MTTVQTIRDAINGQTGSPSDLVTADRLRVELSAMPRSEVYAILSDAGVEGLRPHDTRKDMVHRGWCRMTARCRARERAEA